MRNKRIRFTKRSQRSVLSDTLPFEVPPNFSNHNYYRFLLDNEVYIENDHVLWTSSSKALDPVMRLLFGVKKDVEIKSEIVTQWGRTRSVRCFPIKSCQLDTIPFRFRISHKDDARHLAIPHPRNQIFVADFYQRFSALIIYYCSISSYSIRYPASVASHSYYKDLIHRSVLDQTDTRVEQFGKEYEQIGSYFVYKRYNNIHKFFESYKYHRAEKKYNGMLQLDLSKCFDSLYTHSVAWAILGKSQTKFKLDASNGTFAGQFDKLMQRMNDNETNGIIIGPEFSRVFAEIILQAVDVTLEKRLRDEANLKHKIDYEAFRYVDDYFIFFNEESTAAKFSELAQIVLSDYKLHLNTEKSKIYGKPIITEITIAKDRIASLFNDEISVPPKETAAEISETGIASTLEISNDGGTLIEQETIGVVQIKSTFPLDRFAYRVNSNRLIVKFKTILKETNVQYSEVLNYTFSVLENKLRKIYQSYSMCNIDHDSQRRLASVLTSIFEFMFFAYAASPKVNHTVRLVRAIVSAVDFLNKNQIGFELKHFVFKALHDDIILQLSKNRMQRYKEVENLYLINSLSHLGREYWLSEATLATYFGLVEDNGSYKRDGFLNHFSITVGFSYVKDKKRYSNFRKFLEAHTIDKLTYMKAHCPKDAEVLMLFLDIVVCPYCSDITKAKLNEIYGHKPTDLALIVSANPQWFTSWIDFNLTKALDSKRSREVY